MKKTLSALSLIFISINAFASLDECTSAGLAKDYNAVIKYCKPYINTNKDALSVLTGAYAQLDRGIEAQKYGQLYIDKYSKDTDKESLGLAYLGVGNYYYFGEDGAKRDIQKGLQYITKGAELGNTTAQEQLGNFYNSNDGNPDLNIAISYKWFEVASINGNQEAKNNTVLQNVDVLEKQLPNCIAQGKSLVATAYLNGDDGLPIDSSKAKKYLTDAIELYKKEDKPNENELKYCPPQKGFDLANAEKLLASL
ncbi:tetratricopeptide repeat protein [Francisella philomiragia]|uniref:Sel1 repeat family protein n=1 Tax=Francisella philomiragia TaxID=28110 RepID=A0A0B6D8V1_9GAMM|nr:SEL1-like repeat protein [Francisella philomiragia]AJI54068.1 sel1 repeat family protein [Francisella philomiragia]